MGLIGTTTAEQYYSLSQRFETTASQASSGEYQLTVQDLPDSIDSFLIYDDGVEINQSNYSYNPNTGLITFSSSLPAENSVVVVRFVDRSLGDYRYITLEDIVNNFVYGYTGEGKVINKVKRSDVIFHAKRGIQEFAYDISKIEKLQEVDVPPNLTLAMPQDYVQYTMLSWVDTSGLEHPIFPATSLTSRPSQSILQDENAVYLYDEDGDVTEITPSTTETKFKEFDLFTFSDNMNNSDYWLYTHYISNRVFNRGSRYGLDPTRANTNGVFVVDEANGQFGFSSDLAGKTIILKYISDGLGTDEEMKVSKLAEDALYKYIYHAIISTKLGVPEYQIARAKKERRASMRNAKIRLYNLNTNNMINAFRGKSKIIK
jgi:hypothetical protein